MLNGIWPWPSSRHQVVLSRHPEEKADGGVHRVIQELQQDNLHWAGGGGGGGGRRAWLPRQGPLRQRHNSLRRTARPGAVLPGGLQQPQGGVCRVPAAFERCHLPQPLRFIPGAGGAPEARALVYRCTAGTRARQPGRHSGIHKHSESGHGCCLTGSGGCVTCSGRAPVGIGQ